jgi:hypothetical protein
LAGPDDFEYMTVRELRCPRCRQRWRESFPPLPSYEPWAPEIEASLCGPGRTHCPKCKLDLPPPRCPACEAAVALAFLGEDTWGDLHVGVATGKFEVRCANAHSSPFCEWTVYEHRFAVEAQYPEGSADLSRIPAFLECCRRSIL